MPEVNSKPRPLVHTQVIDVAKDNNSYSVDVHPADEAEFEVEIIGNYKNVQLPNGLAYNHGDKVLLTVRQLDDLSPSAVGESVQINGPVGQIDIHDLEEYYSLESESEPEP